MAKKAAKKCPYFWHKCKCPYCGVLHEDLVTGSAQFVTLEKHGRVARVTCDACYRRYAGPVAADAYIKRREALADKFHLLRDA